jgi:hypothetical protein
LLRSHAQSRGSGSNRSATVRMTCRRKHPFALIADRGNERERERGMSRAA